MKENSKYIQIYQYKKINKITLSICVMIIICIISQFTYVVKAAGKTVTAKDLIDIAGDSWAKNYNSSEASLTREYVDKTAGEEIMKKIDKDYKNIKITKEDLDGMNLKQNLLIFAALYAKWSEMSQDDKDEYKGENHFNFDAIYSEVEQNQIDDKVGNILGHYSIYKQPEKTGKSNGSTSADRLDQIIEGADDFVSDGNLDGTLSSENFKSTFADIYNIFLQIGVGVSVIVGLILGIKFMLSGIEEKAEVKKMLVVYVVACVVIFGSFGIWKLLLNILQQM